MRKTWLWLAATATVLGCASAGTQSSESRGDRNVLTQAQLAATNSSMLLEAVEKLRPEWLTSRGPTSVTDATPSMPSVFLNGQMLGKVESMGDVRVADVASVRYWPAAQASARFGMGHPRGVIEITQR